MCDWVGPRGTAITPRVRSSATVIAYADEHRCPVITMLQAVRLVTGSYPPPPVTASTDQIGEWLERYPADHRWVAVQDGEIVGHVQIASVDSTDPDLATFLHSQTEFANRSVMEISRLFVRPGWEGRRIGTGLLTAATGAIRSAGAVPVLDVLETQTSALALYRRAGWIERGTFVGKSGITNRVFTYPSDDVVNV